MEGFVHRQVQNPLESLQKEAQKLVEGGWAFNTGRGFAGENVKETRFQQQVL